MFQKIYVEVHNHCNLRCSFCPTGSTPDQQMSLESFKRVLNQVKPLTQRLCLHILGEPLLHPDIQAMLDHCHHLSLQVELTTNGLVAQSQSLLLEHPCLVQINFSLQSFSDNFSQKDPRPYLRKILSTAQNLLKKRENMYVHLRIWDIQDRQSLNPTILSLVESELGCDLPKELNLKSKKRYELLPRLFMHFDSRFVWPSSTNPILRTQGTCKALDNHFGILANGNVIPCCLDYQGTITLGNIHQQSLEDILSSERARNMKEGFAKNQLREDLCQRCQYSTRFRRHPKAIQRHPTKN